MSVISSLWAVYPRENNPHNLVCLTPPDIEKLIETWEDIPSTVYGYRQDEKGEIVEQFMAFLFYETELDIMIAAQWAYPAIVSQLEMLTPAERFISSLEGGEYDIKKMLGLD